MSHINQAYTWGRRLNLRPIIQSEVATLFRTLAMTINVQFPALSDFVAFLREREQQKVDIATAAITLLIPRLQKPNTGLQDAIEKQP